MTAAITIHIDRLDFSGLSASEARRAARSFETELAALLARHGLPAGMGSADLERIDLGRLTLGHGTPEAMGRQLAQALLTKLVP